MVRLTRPLPFVHRAWERCLGAALAVPLLCAWAQARAQQEGGQLDAARQRHARVESTHSRSMVISRFGIVASSQPLASRAGTQILEQGGNAVDAAIATNAVLGLVEPTSNGIGGDLFAMVYIAKTGKLYGLNASGWAPGKLTIDLLKAKGRQKMPLRGIFAVTVPGAVSGWDLLRQRFGSLPFAILLKPAIYYAQEGFPVSERIAAGWKVSESLLAAHPNSKATYLPGGRTPQVGEIFRNPDLARSLERIARDGRDGFYRGATAQAIVDISRAEGGVFELADLADFAGEWVEPISTSYRGWTVYELPPNGQGLATLAMLNLMEKFPLGEYGHNSVKALHVMIEAKKLAYADMLKYVGDPKFSHIPVQALISKSLADRRVKEIQPDRARSDMPPSSAEELVAKSGSDTIYMSAIDKDGNIVSLIQSNYSGFGSGVVPAGAGFMLQNRGALFSLEKGHPNALAPHKRPLHTIIPAFMEKDGITIGFGIMGGWNQAQAHAQFVSNVADFHMNIQGALEAARFTKGTFEGTDVSMEPRIAETTRAELTRMGHKITVTPSPYSNTFGTGQAVMRDTHGVNYGGSDPRADGEAIPEAPPIFLPPGGSSGKREKARPKGR